MISKCRLKEQGLSFFATGAFEQSCVAAYKRCSKNEAENSSKYLKGAFPNGR